MLGGKFNLVRPDRMLGPSLLRVPVTPRQQIVAETYNDVETRARLESTSREVFGHAFGLQFVQVAESELSLPKTPTGGSPWQEDPMIKEMVKLFDAKQIRVERTSSETTR